MADQKNDRHTPSDDFDSRNPLPFLECPAACVYAPPEVMRQMQEERERQHAEQRERDRLCEELKAAGITPPAMVVWGPLEEFRKWSEEHLRRAEYPRNFSVGDGASGGGKR